MAWKNILFSCRARCVRCYFQETRTRITFCFKQGDVLYIVCRSFNARQNWPARDKKHAMHEHYLHQNLWIRTNDENLPLRFLIPSAYGLWSFQKFLPQTYPKLINFKIDVNNSINYPIKINFFAKRTYIRSLNYRLFLARTACTIQFLFCSCSAQYNVHVYLFFTLR